MLRQHARSAPPAEQMVLLWCARAGWRADAPALRALLAGPLDWPALRAAAARHGLAPRLAWWVAAHRPHGVPPDADAELRAMRRTGAQLDLSLRAELRTLLAALAAAGVPAIPYKGPLLGLWLDGEAGLRPSSDLDLLVRPGHLAAAQALLAARGYRPKELPRGEVLPLAAVAAMPDAVWSSADDGGGHAQHWVNLASGQQVDLHRELGVGHLGIELPPPLLWALARPGACDGAPCWRLPPELWLVLLCAHAAKHHWERLRWLADVAALLAGPAPLDWGRALELARASRSRRALASGLLLAEGLLGAPLPPAVRRRARRSPPARWLAWWYTRRLRWDDVGDPSPRAAVALAFALRDDAPAALARLWRRLTRPTPADAAWLPPWLHGLAPALRPLRLLRRYGAGRSGRHARPCPHPPAPFSRSGRGG